MDSRSIKEGKYREDEGVKARFFHERTFPKEEAIEKQKDHSAGFLLSVWDNKLQNKDYEDYPCSHLLSWLGSIVLCDLYGQEKKLIEALVKVDAKEKETRRRFDPGLRCEKTQCFVRPEFP